MKPKRNLTAVMVKYTQQEILDKYTNRDARGMYCKEALVKRDACGGASAWFKWKGYRPIDHDFRWVVPRTGIYASYLNRELLPGYLENKSIGDRLNALDKADMIGWSPNGIPYFKRYFMPGAGKIPGNIWNDICGMNSRINEKSGYPTQKPIKLLDRIIKASSDEGDIVLDPFCGSGTTAVAAELLRRKWIMIDINANAIKTARERIKGISMPLFDG